MSRCRICGEKISRLPFYRAERHPHYKSLHPDYVKWHGRFIMKVLKAGLLIVILVLYLDIISLQYYGGLATYPLFLVLAYVVAIYIEFLRNLVRFRHQWNEHHPPLPDSPAGPHST